MEIDDERAEGAGLEESILGSRVGARREVAEYVPIL